MAQPPAAPSSVLHFDMFKFRKTIRRKSIAECRHLFLEFVKQELLRRPPQIPVEEFSLEFEHSDIPTITSSLDSLLRLVTATKARMLSFNFHQDSDLRYMDAYKFPFSEVLNSSLEVLELDGCDLAIPCTTLSPQLNSITEMQLNNFHCGGDGNIEHLVASCVNLETLVIREGHDLKRFKVALPKLQHFTLHCAEDEHETSVEVCAPRLESMEFCVGSGGMFAITDTSSLVRARVDFHSRSWRNFTLWTNVLSFVSGVEHLAIQNMWTWFQGEPTAINSSREKEPQGESHAENVDDSSEDEDLEGSDRELQIGAAVMSETFAFLNLKHLDLLTGYLKDDVLGMVVVLKKCPQLVTLTLVYKYHSHVEEQLENDEIADRPSDLHLPHLIQVEMKDYRGTLNEQNVARLLMRHGQGLEKVVACPPSINGKSKPPFVLWTSMKCIFKK